MDGQDETALHLLVPQTPPDPHHRQLDDVGGSALNGGVAGHPLTAGPDVVVVAGQLGQGAAASEEGGHIAAGPGVGDGLVHIAAHLRESGQIVFQEGVGLLDADADVLREAVSALAVHDAEVDGFGRGAETGRDLLEGQVVDLRGGAAVDVLAGQEGLLHMLVAGDVGEDAQLDLAVIGVYQHAAGPRHKVGAELAAQLGADGDVLQVGVVGGEASGAGFGLVEAGVDAPILRDDLQKTLDIGGVELLVGAVLQNVLHQRVVPQGLQSLGVGGPAALGLLAVGQAHGVEEHLAQLLGAVGVEAGAACLHMDAGEDVFQLGPHFHAELLDALPVHEDADAGHVGQHLCQRELDVVVERVLAQRGDLRLHLGEEVGQSTGVRPCLTGEGSVGAVADDQLGEVVLRGRSVQQIRRQLAVPDDAAAPAARRHRTGVERGAVEDVEGDVRVVQQAEEVVGLQREDGPVLHGIPCGGLQLHDAGALLSHDGRPGRHEVMALRLCGQSGDPGLRQRPGAGLGRVCSRRDVAEAEAGDEGVQLQLLHQPDGLGLVALTHDIRTLGGVDGGIGADGAQRVAQLGHRPVLGQMLPLLGLDGLVGGVVEVGVDPCEAAVFLDEGDGALLTDALDARDVVGGVAHQALDVDELAGGDAVFLLHGLHVHGDGLAAAHSGGGQQDGGGVADQLQAVPVSGGEEAVIAAGGAGGGQGAEDVVGLPALRRHLAVAQRSQKLFQHRHLCSQLVGHLVAGGLVAVVHFMAEGGGLEVEGHGHLVGVTFLEQGEQDIQKAENGVGVAAVLGGQQLDAVKGTVGDAVAVDDQ